MWRKQSADIAVLPVEDRCVDIQRGAEERLTSGRHVLRDIDEVMASDVGGGTVAIVPYVPSAGSTDIVAHPSDQQLLLDILRFSRDASRSRGGWFDWMKIPHASRDDLDTLAHQNIVECKEDGFGGLEVRIVEDAVRVSPVLSFSDSAPAWEQIGSRKHSFQDCTYKLVLGLLLHGWTPTEINATYIDVETAGGIPRNVMVKSKWMILCMLAFDMIAAKMKSAGIPERLHTNLPAGYYQALYSMRCYKTLKELPDLENTPHARFLQFAKTTDGMLYVDEADQIPPACQQQMADAILRPKVSVPHEARPVQWFTMPDGTRLGGHFDFYSHGSNRQRGYLKCPFHGVETCKKYKFVDTFASHQHCTAFVLAWAEQGARFPHKTPHLEFRPCDDRIAFFLDWLGSEVPVLPALAEN